MKPSVQVVIPTRNQPHPEVVQAVQNLSYRPLSVLIHRLSRPVDSEPSVRAKYVNAAATRNAARDILLRSSKASHYLWIDDDVIVPSDVIENLLFLEAEAAGGWYPVRGRLDRWVAGRWASPGNVFCPFGSPRVVRPDEPDWAQFGCVVENELTGVKRLDPCRSDLAPLGCLLITRAVLELIKFKPGVTSRNLDAETGEMVYLGDCGEFGDDLIRLGEWVKMSHRVVCQHLDIAPAEGGKQG